MNRVPPRTFHVRCQGKTIRSTANDCDIKLPGVNFKLKMHQSIKPIGIAGISAARYRLRWNECLQFKVW